MTQPDLLLVGLAFTSSFVVGLVVTHVAIRLGRRTGLVVKPRLYGRSESPITYLGGPSLAFASVSTYLTLSHSSALLRNILLAGGAVLLLGFIDDRLSATDGVSPRTRLAVEGCIAAVAWATGVSAYSTGPKIVDAFITIAFLVAGMNAFNLIDNMDGVAGVTATAVSFGITALALAGNQLGFAILSASIGAASAAFLCFNFVRPKAYLGDSGSLFLGLTLSALALTLNAGFEPPGNFIAAVVIFAVPFTDTATRQLSRWISGGSVLDITGGTDHLSHRLVQAGFSSGEAARLHGIAGLFAGAAAGIATLKLDLTPLFVALSMFSVIGLAFVWLARREPLEGAESIGAGGHADRTVPAEVHGEAALI